MYKVYSNLIDRNISSDNAVDVCDLSEIEQLLEEMDIESDIYTIRDRQKGV